MEENKMQSRLDEIRTLKQKFAERSKELIFESFKDFFVEHPEVEEIKWQQFTPFFNDGDACVFSVGELYVKVKSDALEPDVLKTIKNAADVDDDDDYDLDYDTCALVAMHSVSSKWSSSSRELTTAEQKLIDDVSAVAVMMGSAESVMLDAFGDHADITATREGFDVKEYDHD